MEAVYIIFLIISGLFGLIIGSFVNVVIIRWPIGDNSENAKQKNVFGGRSRCVHCGNNLKWYHMIPVVSFFVLRRHCAYCKKQISWQYPIVELLTALVFVGISWKILSLDFLKYYFFSGGISQIWVLCLILLWFFYSAVLIILSFIDLKHFILPDKLIFGTAGVALLADIGMYLLGRFGVGGFPKAGINFAGSYWMEANMVNPLASYLVAAIGLSLFLFLFYFFSRGRAMGFGDVKFAILLGLMLGVISGVLSFFVAFIIGAIVSLFVVIFSRKKFKDPIPFGPFLVLGVFVVVLWGQKIIDFYFSLFRI